jgi:hypothetical protein
VSLPHIAFYVGDWRKDVGIQSLSYYHRGIWFELLMLMHCSEQRGRLVLAGKPMPNASLSRLLGLSERETSDAVEVLLASAVASRELDGTIYCRRMVREEERRERLRRNGSKGGSKTSANREANPYQDADNDNDIGLARSRVREFSRGEGITERDADWFFDKCEGNGWTNGGQPIRDWKATLQSWKRAGYLPSQKAGRNGQQFRERPKERAPSYPKLPEKRETTEEEYAKQREIIRESTAKLAEELRTPR